MLVSPPENVWLYLEAGQKLRAEAQEGEQHVPRERINPRGSKRDGLASGAARKQK